MRPARHSPAICDAKMTATAVRRIILGLAAAPLMWLVLFYALVLHARLLLGHWPEYNAPDPKNMGAGVGLHMAAIYFGIPIAFVAPVLALILTFAFRAKLERRTHAVSQGRGPEYHIADLAVKTFAHGVHGTADVRAFSHAPGVILCVQFAKSARNRKRRVIRAGAPRPWTARSPAARARTRFPRRARSAR